MKLQLDSRTPVVVLGCEIGGLAIMRSLSRCGVSVHGIDASPSAPGLLSRYRASSRVISSNQDDPPRFISELLSVADYVGTKSILIPTSDEMALFLCQHRERLTEFFVYPSNHPKLISTLIDKSKMCFLAQDHQIPTPETVFPQSIEDVEEYIDGKRFPVMLKASLGNRLYVRTGRKMVIANSQDELLFWYRELEDPAVPSLMLQECIPGDDDQVFIFNGYFDENSECLTPFTGRKIRQFPIHTGCASLGICEADEDVADLTKRFMKAIGYRGVLDIGYRLDPRDGKYKVLDINPRVGQAFRMFVSSDGLDVVRDLYMDLTGQPRKPGIPLTGRKWIIEDFDIISSIDYFREGTLSLGGWLKSFGGVREAAYFSWGDWRPFLSRLWWRLTWTLRRKSHRADNSGSANRMLSKNKSGV